jgi:hypothetical protein
MSTSCVLLFSLGAGLNTRFKALEYYLFLLPERNRLTFAFAIRPSSFIASFGNGAQR